MPDTVTFQTGQRSTRIGNLTAPKSRVIRITLSDMSEGVLARSNPLAIRAGETEGYWGDLHRQSGETVGINAITAEFDAPGSFVAFPDYEWSGNTSTGGDQDVFFRHEGRKIRCCSHALLMGRTDLANNTNTTEELFDALQGEECALFGHVGGQPANIAQADSGALRTTFEAHSVWGTFPALIHRPVEQY